MAASQGWSRWYDDAPDHPKFLKAGHKAGWLYVCGQAYASKHATDGLIPKEVVPRLSDVPAPMKVAQRLVEVGLWHDRGDHFEQHDYPEMQTTAAEREEKRERARERQRRSRHRQGDNVTHDVTRDSRVSDAQVTTAEAEAEAESESGSTRAEEGSGEEAHGDTSRGKPRSDRATRIPDGWTPDAEEQLQAEAQAAGVDLHRELERFRDHWQAKSGKDGRKADWQATWRNWLRKAIDDKPQRNGRPPPANSKGADYAERYEAAAAQARSEGR